MTNKKVQNLKQEKAKLSKVKTEKWPEQGIGNQQVKQSISQKSLQLVVLKVLK